MYIDLYVRFDMWDQYLEPTMFIIKKGEKKKGKTKKKKLF
jgi:hypothetical protein